MDNVESLVKSLDLVYYEYDEKKEVFLPDQSITNSNTIYMELIKITHALSKCEIRYFVDGNQKIFINSSGSIFTKIKRLFSSFFENIKYSNANIYILSDKKVKWAKNLPMIKTEPIKVDIDYSKYDAIIFTSKNAIIAINSFDKKWKNKPIFTIAPQTTKMATKLGGKVRFTGKTKHGNEFAYELINMLKDKKVLYIRGSKTVANIAEILNSNGVECEEAIVYDTICVNYEKDIKLPKNSIVIFSSPSTIECFFKNTKWDSSYKAISIGNTTKNYFPENIIPLVASTTSLESCVRAALNLKNKDESHEYS